jgi:hypothetical protein
MIPGLGGRFRADAGSTAVKATLPVFGGIAGSVVSFSIPDASLVDRKSFMLNAYTTLNGLEVDRTAWRLINLPLKIG